MIKHTVTVYGANLPAAWDFGSEIDLRVIQATRGQGGARDCAILEVAEDSLAYVEDILEGMDEVEKYRVNSAAEARVRINDNLDLVVETDGPGGGIGLADKEFVLANRALVRRAFIDRYAIDGGDLSNYSVGIVGGSLSLAELEVQGQ